MDLQPRAKPTVGDRDERERERGRRDGQHTTWFRCCKWECRPLIRQRQRNGQGASSGNERLRATEKRESVTAGESQGLSVKESEWHNSKDRQNGRDRAARHAGRLSVSGLWECGRDTVVGSVPALKLESGAKRREPEPKAIWELPGAASPAHRLDKIYCRATLQTVYRSWCIIYKRHSSTAPSLRAVKFTAL